MSHLNHAAIATITAHLRAGPKTADEIAQLAGMAFMGVRSCLGGMERRGVARKKVIKPGKPAVWRLV